MIRTLPDEMMKERPWLPYWLGIACLPFNPVESLLQLERAYHAFEPGKDRTGMFLTCAAAFEAFIHQWGDFTPADRWIERVETLLEEDGYPSAHVEASIVPSMCHILVWRNPLHSNFPQWCKRLSDLVRTTTDLNQRAHMASILLAIASWNGNLLSLAPLLEDCRMISKADDISPMTRLCLLLQEAVYAWYAYDPDICRQVVEAAMTIADDTGIHLMDSALLSQGVYNALSCDALEGAEEYLSRIFPLLDMSRPLDVGHYHYLKGWQAFAQAELKTALAHTNAGVQSCIDTGIPFPLALNHFAMANILLEMKRHEEAEKHLDAGLGIAYAMNSLLLQYMGLSIRAYYGFEGGMNRQAMEDLQHAFSLGKKQDFLNTPWWRSDLMAELCVKALELGIEPDYAGTLIRKRNLIPKDPPLHLDNWPWPVKIHALGTFTLFQDGTPVRFSGKVQKKPLELLKALIAFGGRDVHTEQLADSLWPDADGGAAYKTLVMGLQRLRNILGYKDAITLSEGRLTLNPRYCWVDVWAFEELLEQGTTDPIKIEQALELYRGPFLDNHIDPFWAISMRERLQRKFLRAIVTLAQYWETRDNLDKAIDCYERGLDVDDLNEGFYRKLIQCNEKLGRRAEALMTYNHCKDMLNARLGVTPSIETQAMYRRISRG